MAVPVSVTGHTVTPTEMISVVTWPFSGQFGTSAAHEVIVRTFVAYIVDVVDSGPGASVVAGGSCVGYPVGGRLSALLFVKCPSVGDVSVLLLPVADGLEPLVTEGMADDVADNVAVESTERSEVVLPEEAVEVAFEEADEIAEDVEKIADEVAEFSLLVVDDEVDSSSESS